VANVGEKAQPIDLESTPWPLVPVVRALAAQDAHGLHRRVSVTGMTASAQAHQIWLIGTP
jgi:hypothetical protein